jgi:hypothetical protein
MWTVPIDRHMAESSIDRLSEIKIMRFDAEGSRLKYRVLGLKL